MTRVLLLIPTASYRAPDFMAAAAKLGLEIVVGSDRGQPVAEMFPGRTLTASFATPEEGARTVATFADAYPLDAVVAVDDTGTVLAARAAQMLALSHNAVEAAEATRNKAVLRERLAAAGLPSPAFRLSSLDEDAERVAAEVAYPCVVKPLSLAASRGVIRADDARSFVAAVRRLSAILERPDVAEECGATARAYLVEGYIPGDEVSLEGLLREGTLHPLALFDKPDPLQGPFFEETIYVTPSRLAAEQKREIADCVQRATRALGIVEGPVHAELRLNADGIWPLDIAARTIGGLCARTLRFGTGMALEEIVLRHATGAPIDSFEREAAAAGVMMIPIPAQGRLTAVQRLDEARAVAGIEEVTMTLRVGQVVEPLPEGGEYLGFIFAKAETPAQVEGALRAAHSRLRFAISASE